MSTVASPGSRKSTSCIWVWFLIERCVKVVVNDRFSWNSVRYSGSRQRLLNRE